MRTSQLIAACMLLLAAHGLCDTPVESPAGRDSATEWDFGGHGKFRYLYTGIPGDSVLQAVNGDRLQDQTMEFRLKAAARRGRLEFKAHGQFITVHSGALGGFGDFAGIAYPGADVINDDRRWFNLTHELHNEDKNATLLRLDRISVGYTGEKTVIRFGRQALSWGNGLLFTPMDILNPFDPASVDKEYKSGDDMLYGQYLFNNGNDLQATAVVRRNLVTGNVERDQSSFAAKFHGFRGSVEYDLLLAQHYGETVAGVGMSADIGGAVWRGDLVWNDTGQGGVYSGVAGASYSWVAGGHNWTGFLEYYYNGFGQAGGDYSPAALAGNPELLQRLARGELFNLGRHYLGVSATLEVTPLFNLSPNVFINLTDPSALAQVVLSYDWKQDLQVLSALNIPLGPNGSEYGGVETDQPDLFLSTGATFFVQLAWYF